MSKIYIISWAIDRLIPVSIAEILGRLFQHVDIVSVSCQEIESITQNSIGIYDNDAAIIFLYEEIEEKDNLRVLVNLRSRAKSIPVLLIDYKGMEIMEIKNILSLGRIGMVSTGITSQELVEYICELPFKEWLISIDIQEKILKFILRDEPKEKHIEYTEIEHSIIDAALRGSTIRQTAEALNLSPSTISTYRSKILKKSGISSFNMLSSAKK